MATSESGTRETLEGLVGTWRRVITEPHAFLADMPETGGLGEPLGFLAACAGVNAVGWLLTGGGIPGAIGVFVWVMVAAVLLAALCVIVAQNLFDGHGGFEPTLRVICYAAAPLVLLWIPVVGGATLVYAGYLVLRGVERVQKVDTTQAVLTLLVAVAVLWILRVVRADF